MPSSPNGPCRSGSTTSTSPIADGTWPGSITWRVRSPDAMGRTTSPSEPGTNGSVPSVMAQRLGGDTSLITLGPVIILSMFVLFWVLTALYVRRANGEFDNLTRALIDEATAPRGGKK